VLVLLAFSWFLLRLWVPAWKSVFLRPFFKILLVSNDSQQELEDFELECQRSQLWTRNGIPPETRLQRVKVRSFASRKLKESFDNNYIKNFCPHDFDAFQYLPSIGASGGILVAWKTFAFSGNMIDLQQQLCPLH